MAVFLSCFGASCGPDTAAVQQIDGPVPDAQWLEFPDGRGAYCAGGVAPALADCVRGAFFADCGGIGPTTLGCSADDCRWFSSACMPDGYAGSPCASTAICCVGDWPFAAQQPPSFVNLLFTDLTANGLQAWNATRGMDVEVVVDPQLAHGNAHLACDGTNLDSSGVTPCGASTVVATTAGFVDGRARFALTQNRGIGGWFPYVDIDATTMKASVCSRHYTDFATASCRPITEPVCASSGTLTLSKLPATTLDFADLAWTVDVQMGTLHLSGSY